jgi:hypothetical protein
LEESLHDASTIAHRIHLFAGRAGNSQYHLGPGESRPSTFRFDWKSPISYGQFHRRSDGFRAGHVNIKKPLTTYKQIPSDLSHVTSTSYVGVASTEQADGKEVAKQIIIFPEELRGAAEGSVLTDPPGATTHSRMTNGSVSRPAASHSRMTNGTVQKGSGTTLVVQYQDGSKTISVPANVAVTQVAPETVTLAAGDTIYLTTDKLPNGTLTTNKILVIAPAVSPNIKQ